MGRVSKAKKPAKGRKAGRKSGRQRLKMKDWLMKMLKERRVDSLSWRDEAGGIFNISWKHASGRTWVEESDTEIFRLYALHTGKYTEGAEPEPKKWKANFRCALNSLSDVQEVRKESHKTGENACKVYRFLDEETVKVKRENQDADLSDPTVDTCDDDTEEASVDPVIKMEVPSPSSDDMSPPASPTDDTDCEHSYSKNGLSNIPNLPSFKNSNNMSGGVVECRFTVIKPCEKIDIRATQNSNSNRSQDDLNSEGEPMNDKEFVEMVDTYRSDYERTDSETSNASSFCREGTLSSFWNDPALIDTSFRTPLEAVVVLDQPETSSNPDWNLASLT